MNINLTPKLLLIIFLFVIICCIVKHTYSTENYYNSYNDYVEAPFFEKDDSQCRTLCNNREDCQSYNYDPLTDTCHLHSSKNKTGSDYIYPHSDNQFYPIYDDYLYKNGKWLLKNTLSNEQYYNKGYRGMLYGGNNVYHNSNDNMHNVSIDNRDNLNVYIDTPITNAKFGYVGEYIGGGHGGRIKGSNPSGNTV